MKKIRKVFVVSIICIFFTSCYSVRLRSVNGVMQPDPASNRDDYYRGVKVVELDTIVRIDPVSKDFTFLIKATNACKTGKLHTIEFKNTFNGLLLNTVTFGRQRRLKVKYVCMKSSN